MGKTNLVNLDRVRNEKKVLVVVYFIFLITIIIVGLGSISAYTPNAFTVNGRLTDGSGAAQTGTFVMNFSFWDNLSGINFLYETGNLSVVTDANGVYQQRIEGIGLNFSQQYYVEVMVEVEIMSPRINMTSVGNSFRAKNVTVSGVAFTSNVDFNDYNVSNIERIGIGTSVLNYILNVIGISNLSGDVYLGNGTMFVNSSNVGIGTTAPAYLLEIKDVDKALNVSSVLYVNGSSGSVGIGTASAPNRLLEVNAGTGNVIARFTSTDAGAFTEYSDGSNLGLVGLDTNGDISLADSSGNGLLRVDLAAPTDSVVIDSAGQVGIGTATPTGILDVAGASSAVKLRITAAGGGYANVLQANPKGLDIVTNDTWSTTFPHGHGIRFMSGDSAFTTTNPKFLAGIFPYATENYNADTDSGMGIKFFTTPDNAGVTPDPTLAMTIDNDGKIGIGTGAPNALLDIQAASNPQPRIYSTGADSSAFLQLRNDGRIWQLKVDGSDGDKFSIVDGTEGTERITIIDTGNVGIGTASPDYDLHLENTGGDTVLAVTDTNGIAKISVGYIVGQGLDIYRNSGEADIFFNATQGNGKVRFQDAGADTLTIDSAGLVGIGTTAPAYLLEIKDVDKALNVSSVLYVNGSSGSVGIGTTSPDARFHVSGGDILLDNDERLFIKNAAGTQTNLIYADSGDDLYIGSSDLDNVYMQDTTGTAVSISSGNVGIGTTAPAYLLEIKDVDKALNVSSVLYVNGSSGNVGIGTATPSLALHVKSLSTSVGGLLVTGGTSEGTAHANAGQIYFGDLTAAQGVITYDYQTGDFFIDNSWDHDNGDIKFRTKISGTPLTALTIRGSGKVGIGTTTPLWKLDVSNSSQGVIVNPNGAPDDGPIINTTGNTNLTITSNGGNVIIKLG